MNWKPQALRLMFRTLQQPRDDDGNDNKKHSNRATSSSVGKATKEIESDRPFQQLAPKWLVQPFPPSGCWRVLLARLAAYISLEICSRSLNTSLAPQLADSGPLVKDWTFDSLRIRRGALPSFKTDRAAGENKDMTKWIEKYLGVGEWVMDQSVAIAGSSGWFERRR
ncbi:hypothetical protein CSIM01_11487 [Colletotrichum simmondsii]|uniref:Uncharacterized protein n=1 Tax=Colletotrichum simmondsii TaxID=703756 RepID=A0A135TWJ4_9PEZI|nr:hypothetical protein CSIM01_11487 [Colletotrichum simmondsii]